MVVPSPVSGTCRHRLSGCRQSEIINKNRKCELLITYIYIISFKYMQLKYIINKISWIVRKSFFLYSIYVRFVANRD